MSAGCSGSCRQGRARCDCNRMASAHICIECVLVWVVFVPISSFATFQLATWIYRSLFA